MDESIVSRFMALYRGHDRMHGTHGSTNFNADKGKNEIGRTARTLREPPTRELWIEHLEGRRPLGIAPVMDPPEGESECHVVWGCVDVDEYAMPAGFHEDLSKRLTKMQIPLTVVRTKSGGAHLMLFLAEPERSSVVQAYLRSVASALGFGGSEIFPKQTRLQSDEFASWLNMPYFGADKSDRYAIGASGRGLTMVEFLTAAESRVQQVCPKPVSGTQVAKAARRGTPRSSATRALSTGGDFETGPPCLEMLVAQGFPAGERNNGLVALATFAKLKYGDDWEEKVHEWNEKYMDPPKEAQEVKDVIKQVRKHDYNYRCNDVPLVGFCNSRACRSRKHGVAATRNGEGGWTEVANLRFTEHTNRIFFLDVDDVTIQVNAEVLPRLDRMKVAALEQGAKLFPITWKQADWDVKLQGLMQNAVIVPVPLDVSVLGEFKALLEDFVDADVKSASAATDIVRGRPWFDREARRHVFTMKMLLRYAKEQRFRESNPTIYQEWIRQLSGGRDQLEIGGRSYEVFWIPEVMSTRLEAEEFAEGPF
jgi:hypothetical protein